MAVQSTAIREAAAAFRAHARLLFRVDHRVHFQSVAPGETSVAHFAHERVLPFVRFQVDFEFAFIAELGVALGALVNLIVHLAVAVEVIGGYEEKAAVFTPELLLSAGVFPDVVCRQSALDSKTLVTLGTLVGLFAGVSAQMRREHPFVREASIALLAHVGLLSRVRPQVAVQTLGISEGRATFVALMTLLDAGVNLLVLF